MKRRLERRRDMTPVKSKIDGFEWDGDEGVLTAWYVDGEKETFGVAHLVISTVGIIETVAGNFNIGPETKDYIIVQYSKPKKFDAFNNGRGWGWTIEIKN